jgi:hypothetical protein
MYANGREWKSVFRPTALNGPETVAAGLEPGGAVETQLCAQPACLRIAD